MPEPWDFPIHSLPVRITREDEDIHNTYQAIVHGFKPLIYYIGTSKYYPIEHRALVKPIMEHYAHTGEVSINPVLTHDYGRMYLDIMYVAVTPTELGDIHYGVRVINSLDGSKRLGIHAIMLRPICTNGSVATEILAGYKRRHVTANELSIDDFIARIEKMMDITAFQAAVGRLKAPCTPEMFEVIRHDVGLPEKYDKLVRDVWDMPEITAIDPSERDTLWGAYNVISYVLTHETGKMSFDRQFDFSVALDNAIARHLPAQ